MGNNIILVKIGGEVADDKATAKTLLQDLVELKSRGNKVILCHGGGPQITRELKSRGIEAKFINGRRVTDADTLKLTCQILLGDINASLVSLCNSQGRDAIGMSGLDAGLYVCKIKDPELGFVGEIEKINTEYIVSALNQGLIPVVASIGLAKDGQALNINADTAAGELAKALKADKYIVFTNVEGLYRNFPDKNSLITKTDLKEVECLLSGGSVVEGMIPKLESISTALKGGVIRSVIVDGRKEHAVLNVVEGLNNNKEIYGTVITQ